METLYEKGTRLRREYLHCRKIVSSIKTEEGGSSMVQPTPLHYVNRGEPGQTRSSIAATFLALNGVLQTPLNDPDGSVGTKGMTLSTVATTSGRCASRKEATDGSLSDGWKAFGFDRVTVGMLRWANFYCSQICADEDEKIIQQKERKKEHQSWLCSRSP